jgi:hypothetical protein
LQVIGCANASAIGTKKGECFELPFFSCIWLQMLVNCCVKAYWNFKTFFMHVIYIFDMCFVHYVSQVPPFSQVHWKAS